VQQLLTLLCGQTLTGSIAGSRKPVGGIGEHLFSVRRQSQAAAATIAPFTALDQTGFSECVCYLHPCRAINRQPLA
jgi:hypothetical protein